MKREMIFDPHEKVWRTADGLGFGIIDDGMCPQDKKHRLKICNEEKYKKFDLINFCRDFKDCIGTAPNFIKGTEAALKSILKDQYKGSDNLFEIAEFKMKIDLLSPDCRNDFLEISYR